LEYLNTCCISRSLETAMTTALEGARVIDFTRHMAGPCATVMLADFGAHVIKVGSMPSGDVAELTNKSLI
jgi:formyl-CoA transferase